MISDPHTAFQCDTTLSSFSCQVEREIIEVLMKALRHTEPELAHVDPTSQMCVCRVGGGGRGVHAGGGRCACMCNLQATLST